MPSFERSITRFATRILCGAVLLIPLAGVASAENLIDDDFSSETYESRNLARGNWKIADGMASVEQEAELYKRHKNHGPIANYAVAHDDATAIVEFKPQGCKTVVFTMDATDGGHAFRVKLRTQPKGKGKGKASAKKTPKSLIVTYAPKQGDEKAELIELNDELPMMVDGEWCRLEVTVTGDKATVKMGDKVIEVQHPQIDQKKKTAKIGFSFGQFAIRKFELSQ